VRVAVVDSSTLINLSHLNLALELSRFFDVVLVPRNVQKEVNKKGKFRYRLNRLYETEIFQRCASADETAVRLLLEKKLHIGEAEALTQAQEKDAAYFIGDEKRAREVAQNMDKKAVGTIRILARLHLDGRAPEPNALVQKLRKDLHFRASDELIRAAIKMASEPI
jgi:predicted nucleic acid-binding protein